MGRRLNFEIIQNKSPSRLENSIDQVHQNVNGLETHIECTMTDTADTLNWILGDHLPLLGAARGQPEPRRMRTAP